MSVTPGRVPWALAALVSVTCLGPVRPAGAQAGPGPRIEVGFGAIWVGGCDLGSRPANETTGSGGDFVLFETSNRITSGHGLEARVGVRLNRLLVAEADGSRATAALVSRISGDFEGAPATEARAGFTRYAIAGSLRVNLPRLGMAGGRLVPFVLGGAGYLRQLHEGNVLSEGAAVYHAGGGAIVRIWSSSGWLTSLAIRTDVRVNMQNGGLDIRESKARAYGSAAVSGVFGF
jgi:hypothetical protein